MVQFLASFFLAPQAKNRSVKKKLHGRVIAFYSQKGQFPQSARKRHFRPSSALVIGTVTLTRFYVIILSVLRASATLRLNHARHLIISAPSRRMVAANGGI
jgi:hypothetical protein